MMYDTYYFDKLKNHSISAYLAPFSTAQRIDDVHGDTELYCREEVNGIEIKYIGLRLNDSSRFILAVVDGANIHQGATGVVIGLEITETHDYAKTLVGNEARRSSWNLQIADFIQTQREAAVNAPSIVSRQSERKSRSMTSYRGRLLVFDAAQAVIANQPIEQGVLCFGGAGTGKSMLLERVLEQYVTLKQGRVAHFAPGAKLCRDMTQSLQEKLPQADVVRLHSFTWEDFLNYLRRNGIDTPPSEGLQPVNLDYFITWLNQTERYKTKEQKKEEKSIRSKYSDAMLWKDYLFTILQLSSPDATEPYISEETYSHLGRAQSYIRQEDRVNTYQLIFKPFLNAVIADTTAYEPRLIAYQLSRQLLAAPDLNPHLFDAIVIDEQTLYHPYQLLCMLLMHQNVTAGWFFMCGDISQSVDMLNPHFVEDLLKLLQSRRVADQQILIATLENNHRNSEMGTRFVSLLHEIEKQIYGSFDRHTHSCVVSKGHSLSGSVNTYNYSAELQRRISQDAEAVVLVPNEDYKKQVLNKKQWSAGQVFTLREMQGSQVMTVVMDGFSYHHAEALHELEHYLHAGNSFPAWDTQRTYAREKAPQQTLTLLEALQAWYTVASRPIESLIITESSAPIHRLWSMLIKQIEIKAIAPLLEKMPTSKEAWLKRINVLLDEQQLEQADALLLREDIWGPKWLTQMSPFSRTEKITFIREALNPSQLLASETKRLSTEKPPQNSTPPSFFKAAPQPTLSTNRTPPQQQPVSKQIIAIKALLNNPVQANFQTLYDQKIVAKYPNAGDYLAYFLNIEVSDEALGIQTRRANINNTCSVFQRLMTSARAEITISALLTFAKINAPEDPISLLKKLGVSLRYPNEMITEWLCRAVDESDTEKNSEDLKNILGLGYNPNVPRMDFSQYGKLALPPLHLAIMKQSHAAVKILIEHGANIEHPIDLPIDGKQHALRPLQCASYCNNVEAIDLLMNHGAELEWACSPHGNTALLYAVIKNNINAVSRLLTRWNANQNHENNHHINSLHLAIIQNNLDMIRTLKEHQVSLNEHPSKHHNFNPVHIVIFHGNRDILQYFIESKIDINSRTRTSCGAIGDTPLHLAVTKNKFEMTRDLLENGALIDATTGAGQVTALMIAVSTQNLDLVNLLIQFHANVNYESPDHKTALLMALVQHSQSKQNACIITKALIKAGADYEKTVPHTHTKHSFSCNCADLKSASTTFRGLSAESRDFATSQDPADKPRDVSGARSVTLALSVRSITKKLCNHCFEFMNQHFQETQAAKGDESPSNNRLGF